MPDRYGEERTDTASTEPLPHECDNGWLGEDEQGRPRPCLRCRPNLANPTTVYDFGVR
ncbi:hypothetical protein [Rhodococcus qingshengii]|uniref:hypothetical protein n=1 Tax=Rhodococcus qingshengii TaxID=334542 RepID=UPI001C8C3E0C|nr:hypothetical protein [Rhodococcus qingshengii]MBX9147751.1 hypothetical protein [Rhodococcus qingshengii]